MCRVYDRTVAVNSCGVGGRTHGHVFHGSNPYLQNNNKHRAIGRSVYVIFGGPHNTVLHTKGVCSHRGLTVSKNRQLCVCSVAFSIVRCG